ncbi:molybdopterin molybdenumtransferase MoeA, partial [bacterium]|nr:molybdopterin molybdenumtransferase MoeA [bacterium]
MIAIEDALNIIDEHTHHLKSVEKTIIDSKGYFLAEDVQAKENAPFFNNSAMDGYCINYKDYQSGQREFPQTMEIQAGSVEQVRLSEKSIARIFTGAALPNGADTIIKQEDVTLKDSKVVLPEGIEEGEFVRWQGNDFKENELLLKKGEKLNSAKISLLASQGIYKIKVFEKAKVAYVVTGNELKFEGDT